MLDLPYGIKEGEYMAFAAAWEKRMAGSVNKGDSSSGSSGEGKGGGKEASILLARNLTSLLGDWNTNVNVARRLLPLILPTLEQLGE